MFKIALVCSGLLCADLGASRLSLAVFRGVVWFVSVF